MAEQDIIIIGAGIAGLATAINLSMRGISVRIFDSVNKFEPIGTGINLLPHATKVLRDMGVLGEIEQVSSPVESLRFMAASGVEIHREDRGTIAGYETPQLSIHRSLLHNLLIEALYNRWKVTVQLGHTFESYEQTSSGVTANFTTANGTVPVQGLAMIGCDGVHSFVRKQMFPDEGPLVQSGIEMWRGIAKDTQLWPSGQMKLVGCLRDIKLVAYELGRTGNKNNLNWVLERKKRPNATGGSDWCEAAKRDDLMAAIRESEISCVDLEQLLDNTDTILYYNLVDRDPLPYWTSGSVTLLGDAAHPMYPFGSNGACQAILDSVALAKSFEGSENSEDALAMYEHRRREATSRVVLLNRELPPDAILEIVDRRTQDDPSLTPSDAITAREITEISDRYKSVAGFAVSQLSSIVT